MARMGLRELISLAAGERLCLPAFDIAGGQGDFLLGVLGACEAARCPAVLLAHAPTGPYVSLKACADVVASCAERSSVPVMLHLDHGRDESVVAEALEAGFDSVMFDGSAWPLEENLRRTKAMAELAHARGAAIEGELGRIGEELTDPDEAASFVRETRVDLLAPAVGNAHGFYKEPPRLRFDLIERIAAAAGVPLSLHGGTGIPLADVRRSARLGVRKMNLATALHRRFSKAVLSAARQTPEGEFRWRGALAAGRAAVGAMAAEYIRELNCEGLV
jgi:ketose-bisphosphate aldolase